MKTVRGMAALLVCWGALALGGAGCGDSTTIVDLTVEETVMVLFEDMAGETPEIAEVALTDLRDDDAYAEVGASLRCASVDLSASEMVIPALSVGAGATVLNFQVEVAAVGSDTWTFLAEYDGSVAQDDVFSLDHPRFTVGTSGIEEIRRVVLSAVPALKLRLTGEVPGGVTNLEVTLRLFLIFSNDPDGC